MEILGDGKSATQKHCEICGARAKHGALCKKHHELMCREQGTVTNAARIYRDDD